MKSAAIITICTTALSVAVVLALWRSTAGRDSGGCVQERRGAEVVDAAPLRQGLRGHLVDALGASVRHAVVKLYDQRWYAKMRTCNFTTKEEVYSEVPADQSWVSDDDGLLLLSSVPEGSFDLWIDHEAFVSQLVQSIRVAAGELTELGDVVLSRGGTVAGTATTDQGLPLSDAVVGMSGTEPRFLKYGRCDERGSFVIRGIPAGSCLAYVREWPTSLASPPNPLKRLVLLHDSERTVIVQEGSTTRVSLLLPVE